jgi:nitroimidazol reductase NimA-like FMN-containing flavoprotein (pyridoxamine 5'-phosphate oxidase superfamily)
MEDNVGERDALLNAMRMSVEERDAFLNDHGSGVLSLARGNEPYAFPVSYGYNPEDGLLCIMLGYASESRKRRWVEETGSATFVVHDIDESGEAESVVVRGGLVEVEDEDAACYDAFSKNAEFTVLHESGSFIEETEFVVYRFEVEGIEGRKFEHDAPNAVFAEMLGSSPQD